MALMANESAWLTIHSYDAGADRDTKRVYLLEGISWHGSAGAAPAGGLSEAQSFKMRIFEQQSLVDGSAELLSSGYRSPSEYKQEPGTWTLKPGDSIECCGCKATIMAVHDNRKQRANPHWLVVAR